MTETSYRLAVKSVVANLEKVRRWAAHISRASGFDERAAFEVEISVYEACANVIEHAYRHDPGQYIDLAVDVADDKLVVTIRDEGGAFAPAAPPTKDIAAIITSEQEGGLGLYIIEACMDEIFYRRQGGKNVLEMVKLLPRNAAVRQR